MVQRGFYPFAMIKLQKLVCVNEYWTIINELYVEKQY